MPKSGPRASAFELGLLVALAAWTAFPVVLLLHHAAATGTVFTGADGLIGADGVLGADQLQYLAWARDAAYHGGLASDLFSLTPSAHVYLEPLFAITGALARLGMSLPLAYLLWKPIAVLALFGAALLWARRLSADRPGARAATIALALFLSTPLTALFSWTGLGGGPLRFQLYLLGSELLAAGKLWGYAPSALGLALVPVALLALERALDPSRGADRAPGPGAVRVSRGPLLVAAGGTLLASWLHPWQGVTLILILAGLAVWQRLRHWSTLSVPAIAAALPLGYYYLLGHDDAAWRLAAHYEVIPRLPPLALLAGLGPLALVAAAGLRRPGAVVIERALLLWIVAALVTYLANDAFAPHALQGLSFPIAVLAVRGGQRLRLPVALGAAAVALLTIPGLAFDARKFVRTARSSKVQYYLTQADARALRYLAGPAPGGGVLAPVPFAAVIPGQTGRAVWVGNGYWSRDYVARAKQAGALFAGRLRPAAARAFVRSTGAVLVLADCRHGADLTRALGSQVLGTRRFGCARVYLLRRGRSTRR